MSRFAAVRTAVGWRAVQQGGVQIIYFARLLILARLLAPEAFGLLAIAMLAVSVLLSLSDVGVVPALVQRTTEDRDEYDAGWTVRLLRAAAVALTLALAAPLVARMFGDPRATSVIQLLALRPLIEAAGSIGTVRLTREFRFRALAMIHVPGALLDACVAIALARSFGVWALVAGSLSGATAVTLLSYILAPHRPRLVLDFTVAAPLVRFGRWVLGTSIIGLVATSGIQLLISRQLGVSELGLYFLATKVAFLPAEAATAVVGSVAFPLYASMQQDDRATIDALRSLLSAQAVVLFPAYVLMMVLAPSLAEVLGPAWAGTAPLIQLIGLAALMGLYADSVLPLLMGRGRPDRVLMIVGAQTTVLLLVVVPLISVFGVTGAAAAWLPAYGAALVTSLVFVRSTIRRPLAEAGGRLLMLLMIALAGGVAAATMQATLSGTAALAAGSISGAVTALLLLRGVGRRMDLGIGELLGARAAQVAS